MRFAIISDIHEDQESLKVVLEHIGNHSIDKLVCLGDISGYTAPDFNYIDSRDAHECLNLARQKCDIIVIGNHDFHAGKIYPQNCSFFNFPENWYELDYLERKRLAGELIYLHEKYDLDPLYGKEDKKFIQSLSEYTAFLSPKENILFSHYVYPNLSGIKKGFYTDSDAYKEHFDFMKTLDCRISFIGHAHQEGVVLVIEKDILKPGYSKRRIPEVPVCISVPPVTRHRDRSGFCIYDQEAGTIEAIRVKTSKQ